MVTSRASLESLDLLIQALPDLVPFHAPSCRVYAFLHLVAREQALRRFGESHTDPQPLGVFGSVAFPYRSMGAIDSVDLFGLDELILFAYYWASRKRYSRVADVGANLGLHSVLMDRCGYEVKAFEPDPTHFGLLTANLHANGSTRVTPLEAAVSSEVGIHEFVRTLGNTTSSHLAGSKGTPYGELERFQVRLEPIRTIMAWADLLKVDIEGHERQVFLATTAADWQGTDMLVEVGTEENARAIFLHAASLGLKLFAQKINWQPVCQEADMPTSYRDGTLFVTASRSSMW